MSKKLQVLVFKVSDIITEPFLTNSFLLVVAAAICSVGYCAYGLQ